MGDYKQKSFLGTDTGFGHWVNVDGGANGPAPEPAVWKDMKAYYTDQTENNMWVVNRVGEGDSSEIENRIVERCKALQTYGGGPGKGFQAPFWPDNKPSYPRIDVPMPPKTKPCASNGLLNDETHLSFCLDGTKPLVPTNPLSLIPGIGFTWGCTIPEKGEKIPRKGKFKIIGGAVIDVAIA